MALAGRVIRQSTDWLDRLGFLIDTRRFGKRCALPRTTARVAQKGKVKSPTLTSTTSDISRALFSLRCKHNITIPLDLCMIIELLLGRHLYRKSSSTSQHELLSFQYFTPTTLEFHTIHVFDSQDGGLRWRIFNQCSSPGPPVHSKFLSNSNLIY